MLDRLFGGCDGFGGGVWIIVLFFLFLIFQDSWECIDTCVWIPFLILLLILCESIDGFDGPGCGC